MPFSLVDTIARALSLMSKFWEAITSYFSYQSSLHPPTSSVWIPPPESFVKVNCDAAWNLSSLKAGLGAIACDHHGICIDGLAKPATCSSVLIAKSEAILEGLSLAKESDCRKIVICSDSKKVITNIRNPLSRGSWRIFPIFCKIRRLVISFDVIQWEWSLGEVN